MVPGLLLAGVLGVLTMTSEYSSGTIRATLAAIPRRPLILAAKAAVFGAVTLIVGEVASFIAFFAVGATLRHGVAAPTLGQPGVLRAVVVTGAAFCLIGLLGLGLGAIIRHSAAAVGVLVAGVYVVAQVIGFVVHGVAAYMPILIVENSLSTTKPVTCGTRSGQPPAAPPRVGRARRAVPVRRRGPGGRRMACSARACTPERHGRRQAWWSPSAPGRSPGVSVASCCSALAGLPFVVVNPLALFFATVEPDLGVRPAGVRTG